MIVLILFYPLRQERFHWLLLVVLIVQVPQYDINYGVSMTFPNTLNEYFSSSF